MGDNEVRGSKEREGMKRNKQRKFIRGSGKKEKRDLVGCAEVIVIREDILVNQRISTHRRTPALCVGNERGRVFE